MSSLRNLFRLLFLQTVLFGTAVKEADQDSLRLLSRSRFNKLRGFAGEETCHTCTLVQPVRDGHDVILWPGDNLKEPFIWISWFARYPINSSTTYTGWDYLGGLNYTRHPHIYKPDYAVDWRGFLSIQNVTTSHNGTEFKGEVKEKNDIEPKRLHIKLFVIAEKEVFSGTTSSPVTSPTDTSTSQQSTEFPSKRSIPISSPTDTTFRPKHSTVDGQWSNWGTWSGCTKTCGHGISTRERTCGNSYPAVGGVTCNGKPFEAQVCLVQACSAGHIPGVEYHSSSNKAWKFVGIVLVLLLVIAIVLMICMYYKYRKVSNALLVVVRENADYEVRGGHGVAANNGNVVEMKDTNIGQKVNTVAVPDVEDDDDDDDDDNDDDDDEEMLNP